MQKIILFLVTVLFLGIAENRFSQTERPNILWVVSEDNTVMLGCYGDKNARTPVLDKLAEEGILYENAFANAPVCAPARSTIITGMYASSLGTINMRSKLPMPDFVKFFPEYLREAGYYCINHYKEDYNTSNDSKKAWDESSPQAAWEKRKPGQPFFAVFNFNVTHEHVLFESDSVTETDPAKIKLPPYQPDTKKFRHDWAQYYDRIAKMDSQIGRLLNKLKNEGLYESTIIFYYGDNGGILPGSKRFLNEAGTHIPMIVRIPEKYKFMFKEKRGTKSKRLVSFVDLAPTVLSLCGVEIPGYMQGKAFLGPQASEEKKYVHMYKQRMDERYDFVRATRDERFRYVRNFMPFLPRGQHIEYLWRIPSMSEWYELYEEKKLNDIQSAFFEPRVCEELYDVQNDPYELHNLANDPKYGGELERMRRANAEWMIAVKDAGFIPEPELLEIGEKEAPFTAIRKDADYDVRKLLGVLRTVNECRGDSVEQIRKYLKNDYYAVRYWGAIGALQLREKAFPLKNDLERLLADDSKSVRIVATEVLFNLGEKEKAESILRKFLYDENPAARLTAINSIERFGDDARIFENDLKRKLNDDYLNVKKAARWILKNFNNKK